MTNNPEVYRETIIGGLQERMNSWGIGMSDLGDSEDAKEFKAIIRGEITDVEKIKKVKDAALKEIGETGTKKAWASLISQTSALFAKAKNLGNKVTEQIKEDMKTVQAQLKKFKSGDNSYYAKFFSRP